MAPLPTPKVPSVVLSSSSTDNNVYEVLETDSALVDPSCRNFVGESPQERLQRLSREVDSLQKEMSDNEQVSKLARDLSVRLQTSTSLTNAQDELMRTIQQRVADTSKNETGVVYELYGGSVGGTTGSSSSSVEERLLKMERWVGATSNTEASILSRMEKVEAMANRVDEKALDEAATRAKVIRCV